MSFGYDSKDPFFFNERASLSALLKINEKKTVANNKKLEKATQTAAVLKQEAKKLNERLLCLSPSRERREVF